MAETLLLLEGGAYRGIFLAGVLDVFMEHGIEFDAVAGISAGAMTGWNYISGQRGRTADIIINYGDDSRYFGTKAFLSNGGGTGFKFIFNTIHEKYFPYDYSACEKNSAVFAAGATNLLTAENEYFEKADFENIKDFEKCIIASSSMPVISRIVKINGTPFLDGGVCEHLPLNYFYTHPQYEKAVAVLTRPLSARKLPPSEKLKRVYKFLFKKYPLFLDKLCNEDTIFNKQREEIANLELSGRLMVLAPDENFKVKRIERDKSTLKEGYDLGKKEAERRLAELNEFLI